MPEDRENLEEPDSRGEPAREKGVGEEQEGSWLPAKILLVVFPFLLLLFFLLLDWWLRRR